jgi:putative spermidine/putrescine transport system ATP-binding protein
LRDELADLLRRLGITAIYVTHDQQEAMAIADRMAVMHNGKIMQIGTAQELYQHPNAAFVARFLGRTNVLSRSEEDRQAGVLRFKSYEIQVDPTFGRTFMIRPENLLLRDADQVGAPGVVKSRTFQGDRITYVITLPHQDPIVVDASSYSQHQPGDIVSVSFDVKYLLPLTEELS